MSCDPAAIPTCMRVAVSYRGDSPGVVCTEQAAPQPQRLRRVAVHRRSSAPLRATGRFLAVRHCSRRKATARWWSAISSPAKSSAKPAGIAARRRLPHATRLRKDRRPAAPAAVTDSVLRRISEDPRVLHLRRRRPMVDKAKKEEKPAPKDVAWSFVDLASGQGRRRIGSREALSPCRKRAAGVLAYRKEGPDAPAGAGSGAAAPQPEPRGDHRHAINRPGAAGAAVRPPEVAGARVRRPGRDRLVIRHAGRRAPTRTDPGRRRIPVWPKMARRVKAYAIAARRHHPGTACSR